MENSETITTEHIVVLIHGIRTHAAWAEMVANEINTSIDNTSAIPVRYGFFDTIRFISPWITRRRPVDRIVRELRDIRTDNPNAKISIIAHSFGTYAIAKALEERDIYLHRIIFCGSIVNNEFRRAEFKAQIDDDPILNDCGTHDIWPVLAQSITWGYGATGTFGFGTRLVRDRFNQFGHGDYFTLEFVRKYWIPFLRFGKIVPTEWDVNRPSPPYLYSFLQWIPLRWIFPAFFLYIITIIAIYVFSYVSNIDIDIVTRKTMKNYSSFVSISGSEQDCRNVGCRVVFHESTYLIAPRGEDVTYEGRAITSGKILSIWASPPADVTNPNQWPENPTYLTFRIAPASVNDRALEAAGQLVMEQKYCPEAGKIGPHLPYDTKYVAFTLDTRTLGFKLKDVRAEIETRREADGKLLPGYNTPRLTILEDGRVFIITSHNVVAGSSIYLKWGNGDSKCN